MKAFQLAPFVARLKATLAVAMNPTFVPAPDTSIEDLAARAADHEEALKRAASARQTAVLDVLEHDITRYVSRQTNLAVQTAGETRAALLDLAQGIASSTTDDQAEQLLQQALTTVLNSKE